MAAKKPRSKKPSKPPAKGGAKRAPRKPRQPAAGQELRPPDEAAENSGAGDGAGDAAGGAEAFRREAPFTLASGYVADPRGTAEERKVAIEPIRRPDGRFAGSVNGNPGNRGGQPGRSGTYSKSFRRFCRSVLREQTTQDAIRLVAQSPVLPAFPTIVKLLAERGFGPVEKKVTVTGEVTHRLVSLDV